MTRSVIALSTRFIKKIPLPSSIINSQSRNASHALKLKMSEAFLRYEKGSETFDFSFRFVNKDLNIDRQFNLNRKANESVHTFLKRIDANIGKYMTEKRRRKAKKNPELLKTDENTVDNIEAGNIALLKQNNKVDLNNTCINVLENPTDLSLVVLGTPYTIKYNAPWLISIKLPSSILAGFPVYPSEFEMLYTNIEKSKFVWYKLETPKSKEWQQIGEGHMYTPTNADIGANLKLVCLPRNDLAEGPVVEVESSTVVEAGPGVCPFEARHAFTNTKLSGKNFRVVSYNILADTYADSDFSKNVLFPYCPEYALAIDYRKLLIIKELIGYNADIICLQEVDKKIYHNDLKYCLLSLNYDGVYCLKGDTHEGIAILYNNKRFEIVDSKSILIKENIDSNEMFKNVWDKITNDDAKQRFLDRSTSVLIVTLRSKENPSEFLVIGNTHLYFHPDADHIRLLQAFYSLTACQNAAKKVNDENPEHNVTIMLCGDFNSTPKDGVYEFITSNYIAENHSDWSSNAQQAIKDVSLSHELSLASACGTPQYTNFTVEFADCLDYIFYETNKLEVTQVLPMPSEEELKINSAIPSIVFPSDHVAICADMKWKE